MDNKFKDLCITIIDKFSAVNLANIFNIGAKLDFNSDDDLLLFFNTLADTITESMLNNNATLLSSLLTLVNSSINKLSVGTTKQYVFDNFLINAWEIMNVNA